MPANPADVITICQDSRPRADWPYEQDWIVSRVMLSRDGYGSYYPLYVQGINTNDGSDFFSNVPLPLSWRYDLTNAKYDLGVID